MEERGPAGKDDRHAVGDCVRLRSTGAAGLSGTIIGFFRREPLTVVVKLATGSVVEVRPEDLERLT